MKPTPGDQDSEPVLQFGRWRLMPASRRLLRDGHLIPLGSRALDLLEALVRAEGQVLTKEALLRRIWPGTIVAENSLQVQMSALRRALGDDADWMIVTVPGRGYRFSQPPAYSPAAGTPPAPAAPPAAPAELAAAAPPPAVPTRPTLAVLPFANMTGEAEQEHLADGLTEDLTTGLSHLRWFDVIARNSAFTYKGRPVDVRQVGRELGAGYVLEGSVRRAGGRLRVTAQLCEAEAGRHVWAQRYDGTLDDVFEVLDRVTESVVGELEPSLRQAEIERARNRAAFAEDAYALYLRALPLCHYDTDQGTQEAVGLLRRAVALDPFFFSARAALAGALGIRIGQRWSTDPSDIEEVVKLARVVVAGGGTDDASALSWCGYLLAYVGRDFAAAGRAVERALALAPNSAFVLSFAGWAALYTGDWQAALERFQRARRLSPVDPLAYQFTGGIGTAWFIGGDYARAAEWMRASVNDRPAYLAGHTVLASALGHLGRLEEAAEAVRALRAISPSETVTSTGLRTGLIGETRERYLAGLRLAGLPE